jgi:hypothetical protein
MYLAMQWRIPSKGSRNWGHHEKCSTMLDRHLVAATRSWRERAFLRHADYIAPNVAL